MGKLLGIAYRTAPRKSMHLLDKAEVSEKSGVASDFRGKVGERQVTVVARESWEEACAKINAVVPWTARRANLLTEGISLENSTGNQLQIGEVVLEITGETAPCSRMEAAQKGLQEALKPNWRGGVTCSVLKGGEIEIGSKVEMIQKATAND